jgi:hypothetical protein
MLLIPTSPSQGELTHRNAQKTYDHLYTPHNHECLVDARTDNPTIRTKS